MTIRTLINSNEPAVHLARRGESRPGRSWRISPGSTGSTPTSVEDSLEPEHLPKFEAYRQLIFIILRALDEEAPRVAPRFRR